MDFDSVLSTIKGVQINHTVLIFFVAFPASLHFTVLHQTNQLLKVKQKDKMKHTIKSNVNFRKLEILSYGDINQTSYYHIRYNNAPSNDTMCSNW